MSETMWPKGAAEKSSLFIAQIAISESPSRMTFSKPSSLAKKRALHAANTSTISTEVGRGMTCVNAAITRPRSLRMMEPKPASACSLNIAPSKFILTQSEWGGFHLVGAWTGGVLEERSWLVEIHGGHPWPLS